MKELYPPKGRGAIVLPSTPFKPTPDKAVRLLQKLFLNRFDVVAVLAPWGKASPGRPENLEAALHSHVTNKEASLVLKTTKGTGSYLRSWRVGAYSPDETNKTKWLCIDLDGSGKSGINGKEHSAPLVDALGAALATLRAAQALGLTAYLERSGGGKGWHVWVFFEEPIPAQDARRLGRVLVCAIPETLTALVGGGVAQVESNAGIELFPKQDTLSKKGVGNMVWLPFWANAPEGANIFYRPVDTAERAEPHLPEDLIPNPIETILKALESLPKEEPTNQQANQPTSPRKPLAPTRTSTNKSTQETLLWASWRKEALAALNLWSVYGAWLTGTEKNGGWLECRDPSSPSGDKSPSAGVADGTGLAEKGTFSTFRTGEKISVFDFLVSYQGAADFNGACKEIANLSGVPLPELPRPEPNKDQGEEIPERYSIQWSAAEVRERNEGKPISITKAADEIRAAVVGSFEKKEITVLRVTLAGGKTEQTIEAIARLSLQLPEGQRIAYHVPNHDLAREVFQRLTSPKYRALGVKVRREFSGPSEDGLLDNKGERVCKIPAWQTGTEYGAGWFGPQICKQCSFVKNCVAFLGYEGDKDASIVISTHHKPITESVKYFVIDEAAELIRTDKIKLSSIKDIMGCLTIAPKQHTILSKVANSLIEYHKNNCSGPSPIDTYQEDLIIACLQKDGSPRAIVRRIPLGPLDNRADKGGEREEHSASDGEAWKAARWIFHCAIENISISNCKIKDSGKKVDGFSSSYETLIAKALKERESALLLDATMNQNASCIISSLTGKQTNIITINVADGLPTEREWEATTATGRAELLDSHNRPNWSAIATLIRRITARAEKRPNAARFLLGTYKNIAAPLDWVARGSSGDSSSLDSWRKLYPTQELAEQSLQQAKEALTPLLQLTEQRGGTLAALWFGKCRGIDGFKDFDAAISIGAPYGDLEETQKQRRALVGTESENGDWVAFEGEASAELGQFFGRLRATLPHGRKQLWMLCLGSVLPVGWFPSQTSFTHLEGGRPRRESVQGEDLTAELQRAQLKAGGVRALARELGLGLSTLQNYLKGRVPPVEVLSKLKRFLGDHETPIREERKEALGVSWSPQQALPSQETPSLRRAAFGEVFPPLGETCWAIDPPQELSEEDLSPLLTLEAAEERAAIIAEAHNITQEGAEALIIAEHRTREKAFWAQFAPILARRQSANEESRAPA